MLNNLQQTYSKCSKLATPKRAIQKTCSKIAYKITKASRGSSQNSLETGKSETEK